MEDAGSCIAILLDKRTGEEFNICRYATSIGREIGNDLVIVSDKTISRQHAQIQFKDGRFLVQDLNSKNGTRVNGKKVVEMTMLKSGDEVSLGLTQMIFLLVPDRTNTERIPAVRTETMPDPVIPGVR
jgi:pSer/pThr/pTyr-binding forkhead associated (FHA) protein